MEELLVLLDPRHVSHVIAEVLLFPQPFPLRIRLSSSRSNLSQTISLLPQVHHLATIADSNGDHELSLAEVREHARDFSSNRYHSLFLCPKDLAGKIMCFCFAHHSPCNHYPSAPFSPFLGPWGWGSPQFSPWWRLSSFVSPSAPFHTRLLRFSEAIHADVDAMYTAMADRLRRLPSRRDEL